MIINSRCSKGEVSLILETILRLGSLSETQLRVDLNGPTIDSILVFRVCLISSLATSRALCTARHFRNSTAMKKGLHILAVLLLCYAAADAAPLFFKTGMTKALVSSWRETHQSNEDTRQYAAPADWSSLFICLQQYDYPDADISSVDLQPEDLQFSGAAIMHCM